MEKKSKNNTLKAAIITAGVAIFISWYSGFQNRELEKSQFESNLILKAVETGDIDSSKRNLKFLVESGFISRDNKKLKKVLSDSILEIKFPEQILNLAEPENGNIVNEGEFLYGQILNADQNPVDSVFVRIYKRRNLSDTTSYSFTYSDRNGLFKVALPKDDKIFKTAFIKKGFKSYSEMSSKNLSRSFRKFKLEKE